MGEFWLVGAGVSVVGDLSLAAGVPVGAGLPVVAAGVLPGDRGLFGLRRLDLK